ncbi:uncharacterized protein DC041_0010898, partial [Schistosoma bovis]
IIGLDAFKKDHYYFWIPIVAPYIGSIIGAIFYELLIGAYLNRKTVDKLQNTIEISQSRIFSSPSSSSSSLSSKAIYMARFCLLTLLNSWMRDQSSLLLSLLNGRRSRAGFVGYPLVSQNSLRNQYQL